jgi:hypothetical protein
VTVLIAAALIIGVIALVALAVIWRGFVLSVMWGWFLVPIGLPNIGLALAIGISATVAMMTHQATQSSEKSDGGKAVAMLFVAPLLMLGVGWVVHQYV